MPSLIWSPRALADLARLHSFLLPKNPDAARRAIRAVRDGVKLLPEHPRVGRPVEGMEPAFPEWWIPFGDSGYVVRYRVGDQSAVILAIRHGREVGF